MAMLAEYRRRKSYNLVPKGKALFEDNDRFGTKMLEKMGWSKGKGLGVRENGQQDFVRVRYKNDVNGLGFEDRDDQWTEHEKHFTGLLETLNSNSDEGDESAPAFGFGAKTAGKEKMRDKFSGQSLEEMSKNSRARVHYKKFTKGKDISQYSEKDLANIFGKKAVPDETSIYDQFQALSTVNSERTETEEEPKESSIRNQGKYFINTGISVNDYFKQKMEALKMRNASTRAVQEEKKQLVDDCDVQKAGKRTIEEDEVEVPRKKKKNKNEKETNSAEEQPAASTDQEKSGKKKKNKQLEKAPAIALPEESQVAKKKKSKKLPKESELVAEIARPNTEISADKMEEPIVAQAAQDHKASPPRKKKQKNESPPEDNKIEPTEPIISEEPSKKKKKRTEGNQSTIDVTQPTDESQAKKTTTAEEDEPSTLHPGNPPTEGSSKKKKSSKSNTDEHLSERKPPEHRIDSNEVSNPPVASKPKKSKTKSKSTQQTSSLTEVSSHQDINHLKRSLYLDTYTISTFCAEKFRNINLRKFHNSNIGDIIGYELSENLELNIKTIQKDEQRITQLWSGVVNKYQNVNSKQQLYQTYMKKAKEACRTKQKIPRMKVKSLKRKNLFQGL